MDDYVFGFTLREILQEMYDAQGDPNMAESGMAFFESQLATGEYPNVSKLFRADLREAMEPRDHGARDGDFLRRAGK